MIFLLHICLLCFVRQSLSEILVIRNHSNVTVEIFTDLQAIFGPPLPFGGIKGLVVYASPPDGCHSILPPPKVANYTGNYIALLRRYNCSFVDKVLNAQQAGYDGAIVRNVGSNTIEVMDGDHDKDLVKIPAVFVGQDDGLILQINFEYDSGYHIMITDDLPIRIQDYLIPFAITIGICLLLMLIFMIVKWVRDYKQSRRHRLSSRSLKKIPVHKFKKGDPYDCCAICLDEYVDNDKLRILPCSHAYHTKCIDPWLTKNRRVCPVCKRKVITGDENPSDLESDSEDETAPLIPAGNNTQGGTFNEQNQNPFQWAERMAQRRQRNQTNNPHSYYNVESSSEEEEGDRQEAVHGEIAYDASGSEDSDQTDHYTPTEVKSDDSKKEMPDIKVLSSKESNESTPAVPCGDNSSNEFNV